MAKENKKQEKDKKKIRENNQQEEKKKMEEKEGTKEFEEIERKEEAGQEEKIESEEKALEKVKGEKKKLTEEEKKQLETVKQILNNKKKLSRAENLYLNEMVFFNLGAAVLVIVYFMLINQLYFQLEQSLFQKELCLFGFGFLFVTILLFEFAYKRDSGKIAVTSIEFLALAITSMILVYVNSIFEPYFSTIVPLIAVAFSIYYLIKSMVQYIRKRNEYWKENVKKELKKD